jgi:hypothetical protein
MNAQAKRVNEESSRFNQVARTITMWEGSVERQFKNLDGRKMTRLAPSRGIRVVTVVAECKLSAFEIAQGYNSYLPTKEQIEESKWRLWIEPKKN